MTTPHFAVVGHPNKGKSSIVSTLAQDDSIYIDRVSGSTKTSHSYPMTVNGEALYILIDTPGFQRARAALDWLHQHCRNASQRPQAVRDFCAQHQDQEIFVNECQLLQPIIDGAGIIYVVDGSRPYGPEYEAEMEILRWTGRPSLALINPIDSDDYVSEWENALGQYFKTVRVFDAHRAEFSKRTALLSIFGQMLPEWETALAEAVSCLVSERERQHRQASELVATMMVAILQHREVQNISLDLASDAIKKTMAEKFRFILRQTETRCREKIEENYAYHQLRRDEVSLDLVDKDLFDQESWYLFGLSKTQLITISAGAGAGAGALIDVGLGGHSLFLGSLIGGLSGGIGAWTFSRQIAEFTFKGLPTGGQTIFYGPVAHPNFPFVVLGRALHHLQLICTRTHANRERLDLDAKAPLDELSTREKTKLVGIFEDIHKNNKTLSQRQVLADIIYQQIRAADHLDQ
jgi:GTPase Era involved in 16S rRNA processing